MVTSTIGEGTKLSQNQGSIIIASTDNQGPSCHKTGVPRPSGVPREETAQSHQRLSPAESHLGRVLPEVLKVTFETVRSMGKAAVASSTLKEPSVTEKACRTWLSTQLATTTAAPSSPPPHAHGLAVHPGARFLLILSALASHGHAPQPCWKQAPNPSASEDVHSSRPVSCSLCHPSGMEVFSPQHLPGASLSSRQPRGSLGNKDPISAMLLPSPRAEASV